MSNKLTILSCALVLAFAGSTFAAVEVQVLTGTDQGGGSDGFFASYSVLNDDLANSDQSTFSTISSTTYSAHSGFGGLSVLNDGTVGSAETGADGAMKLESDSNVQASDYSTNIPFSYEVLVEFDTTVNALGYDVTSIRSLSDWSDRRRNQLIRVFYSVVGDSDFTEIGSSGTPVGHNEDNAGGHVGIVIEDGDDPSTVMASGVDAIRVDVYIPRAFASNDWREASSVMREIDVVGSATIPEPASLALLAAGGLYAIRRRRR